MSRQFVVLKSGVVTSLRNTDSSRSDDFEEKVVAFYDGWSSKVALKPAEGKRLWKVRQTSAALRGIGVWWGEYDEDVDVDADVSDVFICFLLYDKNVNEREFKNKVPLFVSEGQKELADIDEFGPEAYVDYHRQDDASRVLPPHDEYVGRESE